MRRSYTAVLMRNEWVEGEFSSEPYECGWASEAIFFVRKLEANGLLSGVQLQVQISPDGIRWCDAGSQVTLTANEVDFCRVRHFGNWLRLGGTLPPDAAMCCLVTLHLKE